MSSSQKSSLPPLSEKAQSVKSGLYKHFKGGLYEVIGVGRLSEDIQQEVVIYKSREHGGIFVRPLEMFLEYVERGGYQGPRFRYLPENES